MAQEPLRFGLAEDSRCGTVGAPGRASDTLPTNTRSISIARPIWSRPSASFIPGKNYGGNRSILLNAKDKIPEPALRHCVALALTYHLNKRKAGNRSS
jgi:hypothetical protein